ncbi:MAG: 2-isopropylmalate synthase [Brevundimonas sp.]|uniref:2-isopropylmalate synthase n=1 Tax=Brevundimonas sp. TaxID=1871086 RepID=UPI000DB61751|nr:2-isopropylmalate synthase [Brevundimonas sp.]PZU00669.1 MAG: 2-isopropylmalate synthase [Brevundimonas sp.]
MGSDVRVSGGSRTEQIAADPNRVIVFDTTMRDGEQAPGFSMSAQAKVKMAQVLRDLGVDVIEAGFAAASPGDEDCIRRVTSEVEGPIFCSLSRANEKDIDASFRALQPAPRANRRCHVFLATSPIHRAAKLKMSTNEVLSTAVRSVEYARTLFDDVEFSAEDAFRTEPEFLADVLEAAADAGARTLNVPDTVGYATPQEVRERFAYLAARIKARHPQVIFSAHCHDDLGMAVANSLAAVEGGARQVEGAINGIGERAGNASIEEVIMALKVREDRYGVTTGADSRHLVRASKILCEITETVIARNKSVVGVNAFAHEAGIHQHGMLADSRTYEIMRPQDVGFEGSWFVLGKHSGRHAIAKRAETLGRPIEGERLAAVVASFKQRADQIGEINDAELIAIIDRVDGVSEVVVQYA